ncbi:MAG: hypothetical protein ACYDBJ_02890 [Aggregatilineales bacterium]
MNNMNGCGGMMMSMMGGNSSGMGMGNDNTMGMGGMMLPIWISVLLIGVWGVFRH